MSLLGPISAHAWTIGPTVLHRVRPQQAPAALPWSTGVDDPRLGPLQLHGSLREYPESDACLIVVHGLGGAAEAHYCVAAAHAAERAGMSCLRLSLRGADLQGEDFYHAGQTADLHAAAACPELARYRRLYVLGYSLGGHVTLCYGLDGRTRDPRVRALAAVCAPLDLERSAQAIDRTRAFVYRYHVLAGLKRGYAAVAARRPVPSDVRSVHAARTLRAWDRLTVVPRYGFASVEHYYASMSAGPRLSQLSVPALLVQVDADPMVPLWTYREYVERPHDALTVERLQVGGHVGFPAQLRLGGDSLAALEDHVLRWLLAR